MKYIFLLIIFSTIWHNYHPLLLNYALALAMKVQN